MSLTSLLDTHPDLVQALVGLVPQGAIPPPVTTPMLAHPVTDHYALVGTSFDYLFRFEVQRRFPRARTQRWVAEEAISMLGKRPGDERARARKVVLAARRNQREYLRSQEPAPELFTRLAEDALRLAKLDSLYRSGTLDPTFDEASSRDVRDLLHLIRAVPFEGPMGTLLREGGIRLNPTFGRYSGLVGGADADLIASTTLVDLKVTKFPDFTDLHLAQLLGYSILADRYRDAERRRFPSLSRVGLYFARHGVLSILDLGAVRGNPEYVAVGDLLVGGPRARRRGFNLGDRIPVSDTTMPLRHDDRPVLAPPKPSRGCEGLGRMGSEGRERVSNPLSSHETKTDSTVVAKNEGDPRAGTEGVSETYSAPRPPPGPQAPEQSRPGTAEPFAGAATPPQIVVKIEPRVGVPGRVVQGVTPYHAKYFAHEITRLAPGGNIDRISQSLFDASVDLQPHQIEAGLFALKSPLSKGVILADEVGLGKTIEAGLVLCQFWAERKRHLLVICPASIRKQWQQELTLKFNLPSIVLDSREYDGLRRRGAAQPFLQAKIVIVSYHYANRTKDEVELIPWDLVVLDEAHRLRYARTQVSQNLRLALSSVRKLLLTATPLQNNLGELYNLVSFIDERTFGDQESFQLQYSPKDVDLADLRKRLNPVVKRTLRKDVLEYVRFTQRHPITVTFDPDAPENALYQEVSEFLQRNDTYSLPSRQRHLMVLLLRKILASSSTALTATLEKMRSRLEDLRGGKMAPESVEKLLEDEVLDEEEEEEFAEAEPAPGNLNLDLAKLDAEIRELTEFIELAKSIRVDSKSKALLNGLSEGFQRMAALGGQRKALVFTESKRTQVYLRHFLEANGYGGQIVLLNGTNTEAESKAIYEEWKQANEPLGRTTGNRNIDQRTALIECFRDKATIMLATEAAGEGVNLQFCSLVINYDLPWNPQRIEQRIGRCHRYGQQHDVVVVNFLNAKNEADRRVLELLSDKFHLFEGVFGSSDEVLGTLESGVDFERKVLAVYQQCRTPKEIDAAFNALQEEMEELIRSRMQQVRQTLLEHFDEEVHNRFRNFMSETRTHLSQVEDMLWRTTKQVLDGSATFNEKRREFELVNPPAEGIRVGPYRMISRSATGHLQDDAGDRLYRISNPLGEYVLEHAKAETTPLATVTFQVTGHPTRIMVLEKLKKKSGWLTLTRLRINSLGEEEHHLFSGLQDEGESIDQETLERMFSLSGNVHPLASVPPPISERLSTDARLAVQAQLEKTLQSNTTQFSEEQDRLERWAEDRKTSSRTLVDETEVQLKDIRRRARQATNLRDRLELKEGERELMARQRKAQAGVFDAYDDINRELESFLDSLQRQLQQSVSTETLFTIRWEVV
jgi:SNF2 family DNA or RNA helicase